MDGGTVAPGASCDVVVRFTPGAVGPADATLTITDDAAGSPYTVALSGDGIAPAPSVATGAATAIGTDRASGFSDATIVSAS